MQRIVVVASYLLALYFIVWYSTGTAFCHNYPTKIPHTQSTRKKSQDNLISQNQVPNHGGVYFHR